MIETKLEYLYSSRNNVDIDVAEYLKFCTFIPYNDNQKISAANTHYGNITTIHLGTIKITSLYMIMTFKTDALNRH